jgi:hypothetical protein
MKAIIAVPAAAVSFSAMPLTRPMPIPSRPSMNNQSTRPLPAQEWKVDSIGPAETPLRNPLVGDPPLTQLLAAGVA